MIILIPAYEPDEQLLRRIRSIHTAAPQLTLVVVDDGSGPDYQPIPASATNMNSTSCSRARQAGYPIRTVDIATVYLDHNSGSHFRPIADWARIYAPLLKFLASATVQELDLVNDKTIVDVRYAYVPGAAPGRLVPVSDISAGTREHLPAIGLEELNAAAALQTRVDRKYVIPALQAQQLLAAFEADFKVLEMDGKRTFDYDSVLRHSPAAQLPAGRQGQAPALQDPHPDLCGQRNQLPGSKDRGQPGSHGQGPHPVPPGRPEPDHRRGAAVPRPEPPSSWPTPAARWWPRS